MELKERVASLPETPGVYLFKDEHGRVIYIGKAKSLRDRVSTYFTASYPGVDPRIGAMIGQIHDLETVHADSEIEAIMLEAKLIKDIRPKYNVKERDDKSFGCLAITGFDDFPKVWFVRETDEIQGEKFGPFPNAADLRRAIRTLQKIFKFATCTLTMNEADEKRRFFRPCLLYSIHRCDAPCGAKIGKAEYQANIESLRRFLRGEKRELIESLTQRMKAAAEELEFERAADLRDQIHALERLHQDFAIEPIEDDFGIGPIDPQEALKDLQKLLGLPAVPRSLEACDIATIQGAESVGSIVTFMDGVPLKDGYRRFRIKGVAGVNDFDMMREVVRRRFARLKSDEEWYPEIFLVDGGKGQLSVAADEIRKMGAKMPVLLGLAKKEETVFHVDRKDPVPMPKESLGLRLLMHARDEAHRFAQRYHHILRRKTTFDEPTQPRRTPRTRRK
jgi:excinuclease ABC subunit C